MVNNRFCILNILHKLILDLLLNVRAPFHVNLFAVNHDEETHEDNARLHVDDVEVDVVSMEYKDAVIN